MIRFGLVLVCCCLLCGCTDTLPQVFGVEEQPGVTFYVASDIHYLAPELNDGGAAFQKFNASGDGKELEYIEDITNAFVRDIQIHKPDVVILSGDLTMNGEKKSHEQLAKKLSTIDAKTTKIFVIPGNHDVLNPYARTFMGDKQYGAEYITETQFAEIYSDFGYGKKNIVLRDDSSLSYLAEASDEVWLLMLDTCIYEDNIEKYAPTTRGRVRETTLQWIETCAEQAQEQHKQLLVVTHHNLIDHSEVIRDGYTLDNYEELLALLKKYQIPLNLSGHIHIQDIASDQGTYDIASGSMAVYPQKYGVLRYDEGWKYTTEWVDVEGYAKVVKSSDENLLAFQTYSKQSFKERSRGMGRFLDDLDDLTEEQKAECVHLLEELNCSYFAGEANTELLESEAYSLLLGLDGFAGDYVKRMAVDLTMDDNVLEIHNE